MQQEEKHIAYYTARLHGIISKQPSNQITFLNNRVFVANKNMIFLFVFLSEWTWELSTVLNLLFKAFNICWLNQKFLEFLHSTAPK